MVKILYTIMAILLIANLALAWTPFEINDRGVVRSDAGVVRQIVHSSTGLHSGTSNFGRNRAPYIHGIVPDGNIETIMIGGITFTRRNITCFNPDTLAGTFKLRFSWNQAQFDSIEDRYADVLLSFDVIVPPEGTTERTFYGSTTRHQGNNLDDLVYVMREVLTPTAPFVLIFEPNGQSGFDVDLTNLTFGWTANANTEDWFLDQGNIHVDFLGTDSTAAIGYHGLVFYILNVQREPWTSERVQLNFTWVNGYEFGWRAVMPAWRNENQTNTMLVFGLPQSFINQYGNVRCYANYSYTIPGGIKCRGDHVVPRMQP